MVNPDFPFPDGYLWQYRLLIWLQSFHSPLLYKLAIALSFLGTEWFYVFALPILFWSVHRKNGLRITYVFCVSMFFNAWLKMVFQIARPIGIPGIRSSYTMSATGFSMPSGHAQGPMTFWVTAGKALHRKWVIVTGVILVLVIGLSRLYLGLHWPLDVLAGWILGLIVGMVGWSIAEWWTYRKLAFGVKLFLAICFPIVLVSFHHDALGSEFAAFLFSVGVGAVLEQRWLHSDLEKAIWKRFCTLLIGIAGIVALQWGMKWGMTQLTIFDNPMTWTILRDLCVGLWATLGAPWLFVQCGLYRREGTMDAGA